MLRIRFGRRWLWLLLALIALPVLWMLQVEFAYERKHAPRHPCRFPRIRAPRSRDVESLTVTAPQREKAEAAFAALRRTHS